MPVADGFELIARAAQARAGRRSSSSPCAAATRTRSARSTSGPTTTSSSRSRCPSSSRACRAQLRRHADESAAGVLEFPGPHAGPREAARRRRGQGGPAHADRARDPRAPRVARGQARHDPPDHRPRLARRAGHDARRRPRPRRLPAQEDRARPRAAPLHRHGAVGRVPVRRRARRLERLQARQTVARTGRTIACTPSNWRRRWIAIAVSLWRRRWYHCSFLKTSLPLKTTDARELLAELLADLHDLLDGLRRDGHPVAGVPALLPAPGDVLLEVLAGVRLEAPDLLARP